MARQLREGAKQAAGWMLSRSVRRYRFGQCIFMLAHMRCGSTALSNVLCSRADISGYGEAHVRYDGKAAVGRLVINHARRGGWKPGARYLFDKILHSRHDRSAPEEFFEARAIFVVRHPEEAIASIVRLFERLGRGDYASPEQAAAYYVDRLAMMETLWGRFPARARIGLSHAQLVGDPDRALSAISRRLGLHPPLLNQYQSLAASCRAGGGDPLESSRHSRIEPRLRTDYADPRLWQVETPLFREARQRFERMEALFDQDGIPT